MINKNESLAKTVKELMFKEPFWGLFLIGFRKSWSKDVPTACVSKNGINYGLTINEDFWDALEDDWKKGILQHEAIHIGYRHLEDAHTFDDHELRNIADDLVVNQDCNPDWLPCKNMSLKQFKAKYDPIIEKIGKDLEAELITPEEAQKQMLKVPPRGVYIEDFPDFKLKPKESRRYYYDKLKQEKPKCKGQGQGQGQNQGQGQSQGQSKGQGKGQGQTPGQGPAQPGKGQGGSGGNATGGPTPSHDHLSNLLSDAKPDGALGHKLWKEFENMSEAEKKLVRSQLEYQLREVTKQIEKSRGFVPGNIKNYLDMLDVEEESKFNWRRYLRRYTGGSQKTYTKKLRRKYNKRFEDNPGLKIKQRKHLFVAIDTSGSVSNEELKIFFNEIDHIQRTGTEVTVCQCDTQISDISTYRSGMKIKNQEKKGVAVYGRGGTSFDPPIDHYNKHADKYSCMVYFTDGECSAPQNPPKDKLLWILSNGNDNKDLPGYRIVFEN